MRYPATGVVFARLSSLALLLFLLTPFLEAQVHGTPPSVTSFGFGGHNNQAPGVPASVTSLGRFGWTGPPRLGGFRSGGFRPVCCGNGFGNHRRRSGFFPGYYYPAYTYAVPYQPLIDYSDTGDDTGQAQPEEQYQGGPTIFDRRGSGSGRANQYVDDQRADDRRSDSRNRREREVSEVPKPPAEPEVEQTPTLLVFKDGHRLELQNYAIVGDTLYNLSGGGRHRIALSDLDLKTTVRENDDRGVDFRLPPNTVAN